jgi:DNA-binding Lrp family transcriptional regulator
LKAAFARKIKRKSLDDEAFVTRLLELDGNRSALAKEIGITPSAVTQRMKKLDPDGKRLAAAHEAGRLAGVIHHAAGCGDFVGNAVAFVGFNMGVEETAKQYKVRERLAEYGQVIDKLLAILVGEMDATTAAPRAKLRPYQVDLCCKLVAMGVKIATAMHGVRRDILKVDEHEKFMKIITGVFAQQGEDIRFQLYRALQQYGAENQAEVVPSEGSGYAGKDPV